MENRVSVKLFLEDPKGNSDNYSNFYDWFCDNKSLERRMLALVPKIKFLVKEGLLNPDKHYVWFKNNCPVDGSLYDDIRFSTLDENDNFVGGLCPRTGHRNVKEKASIWFLGKDNEFIQHEYLNWSELKKELKTNKELREETKRFWG